MLELADLLAPYSGPLGHYNGVPLVLRLAANIDYPGNDVECWPWRGCAGGKGYCQIAVDGRLRGVHRVVYEILVGPIPDGLELDHTCHDPASCPGGPTCQHRRCCNPCHVVPSTGRDNVLRGNTVTARFAAATHCVNGHPFAGENLSVRVGRYRRCRTCARAATARWRSAHG